MRIIVVSDTHGRTDVLERVLAAHPDADRFIHLGDGMGDIELFRERHPTCPLYSVRGNTDTLSTDPEMLDMTVAGQRILCVHGHTFSVKRSDEMLRDYAQKAGYDIVLYGHTHQPVYHYSGGIHFLNPGSAVSGVWYRFGIVDITSTGVVCMTAEIPRNTHMSGS